MKAEHLDKSLKDGMEGTGQTRGIFSGTRTLLGCCTLEMDERAGNNNTQSSDLGGGDAINQMQARERRDGFKHRWRAAEEGEQIMGSLLVLLCSNARGAFRSGTDPAFVRPEAPTVKSPL